MLELFLTHLCRVDSSIQFFGRVHFHYKGCLVSLFFLSPCFIYIHILNANSVDPDQTLHSALFDLDLHCMPMSHLWDTRLKWVNDVALY